MYDRDGLYLLNGTIAKRAFLSLFLHNTYRTYDLNKSFPLLLYKRYANLHSLFFPLSIFHFPFQPCS